MSPYLQQLCLAMGKGWLFRRMKNDDEARTS
jgi:hypothetical protein